MLRVKSKIALGVGVEDVVAHADFVHPLHRRLAYLVNVGERRQPLAQGFAQIGLLTAWRLTPRRRASSAGRTGAVAVDAADATEKLQIKIVKRLIGLNHCLLNAWIGI